MHAKKKGTSELTSSALIFHQVKLRSESVGVIVLPRLWEDCQKIIYVNREPRTIVQRSNELKK